MKRIWAVLLIMLLLPVCALADVRRGDSGEDVREIQQLLFDTGFLFEEPDGKFGKRTEAAVKEFQQAWGLPVTGVVTEEDHRTMVDCWLSLYNADGTPVEGEPLPDDQLEAQPLSADIEGVLPVGVEGGRIEAFSCSYSGESVDAIRSYAIRRTERGYLADMDLFAGQMRVILSMTQDEVDDFAAILGDLSAWDGFHGSLSGVLDGERFDLHIAYADGTSVDAGGDNAFPEGYFETKSAIDAFFDGLMKQYGIDEYDE